MEDRKNKVKGGKSLTELWATHNHEKPLRVYLGKYPFHVKQKTKLGGFTLSDEHGATFFIRDSAASPIWVKILGE